jgi:ADP-heptose:LPS heptosyltransferase
MSAGVAESRLAAEIRSLQTGPAPDDLPRRLKEHALEAGGLSRKLAATLCDLAASGDAAARARANTLIFRDLVEPLGDAFDPALAELYDRTFSEIIDEQRRRPGGEELHVVLDRFGLPDSDAIASRRRRLRQQAALPPPAALDRVVVLSRVTIGSDVAITSVIVGEIRRSFPAAEVVLIGPPRVGELFAGDTAIRLVEAPYPRRGTLTERLGQWPALVSLVEREKRGIDPGRFLIVDPDSRLTQLGLLPPTDRDSELRTFESRSAGAGADECLGRLAAAWARITLGSEDAPEGGPYIRLERALADHARKRIAAFSAEQDRRTVAVSFGVGGNPAKRLDTAFESGLLLGLLDEGHRIVLDRGIDSDREASQEVLATLGAEGRTIAELRNRGTDETCDENAEVLAWDGGVGMFAALIANSDLYIGYDSAFQHIAAALGVPVLAIVEGAPNADFRARWTPYSSGPVRVLSGSVSVAETLTHARGLLATAPQGPGERP